MTRALSFGSVAERYDRFRPQLPEAAARWLGAGAGARVVDVAAGTGLATRAFAAVGASVISVEPDDRMRQILLSHSAHADARAGSAEALPVEDASADVVAVVSAWHWVDEPAAIAEAARVLVDGGTLAIASNSVDWRVPGTAELFERHRPGDGDATHRRRRRGDVQLADSSPFAEPETTMFEWRWERSVDEVVELSKTYSGVITSDEADQRAVGELVRQHALALAGAAQAIVLPMATMCWRARRAARAR